MDADPDFYPGLVWCAIQNADYLLHCRRNRNGFFRPLKRADSPEFDRFPQADAWGYHLTPPSGLCDAPPHNLRNIRRTALEALMRSSRLG